MVQEGASLEPGLAEGFTVLPPGNFFPYDYHLATAAAMERLHEVEALVKKHRPFGVHRYSGGGLGAHSDGTDLGGFWVADGSSLELFIQGNRLFEPASPPSAAAMRTTWPQWVARRPEFAYCMVVKQEAFGHKQGATRTLVDFADLQENYVD